MSAHAVVFEVWLHVETDCSGFLLILSRELAQYYHALLWGYFLDHLRGVLHGGQKEAKWRENVVRVQT